MKFSNSFRPYIDYQFQEEDDYGSINFLKQRNKLRNALQKKISFEKSRDLGLFGEILGYVNAAVVVSLAAIHINKYYLKEEPKKKTKEKP